MKRKLLLVLCLLLAALMLSSCSSKPDPEEFPDITQAIGPTGTPAPTAPPVEEDFSDMSDLTEGMGGESIFSANPYDVDDSLLAGLAAEEENYVDPKYGVENLYSFNQPAGTPYPYAGSTPIPLDPLDMPSPTPRPDLNFTYATYTASTVGVSFSGPISWQIDQSLSGMFILSEPNNQIKDDQQCIITISAEPVSSNYSQSDLKSHVKQRLNTIGGDEYTEWNPSLTATRYMMGQEGVYANYSATTYLGTEVGGRIHYVCLGNTLYGLEIVYPLGFKDDFLDVFGEIRSSMKQL